MASSTKLRVPESLWNAADIDGAGEADLLLYRSNLLGADLAVTNFGGGNTSAKIIERDPLTGEEVEVLWVKGSGGDLGSMTKDGFSTLYLEKLRALERLYRGIEHEDEMVDYLPHCTFDLNPRAASIDTPLHTFLPYAHIDHTHPDAVIAIAASEDSERLTGEVFGGDIGWLPWQRPGFDLGLRLRDCAAKTPGLKGVLLEGHGLFTWGETAADCYRTTIDMIARAARHVNEAFSDGAAFGGQAVAPLGDATRRDIAAALMPAIRDRVSASSPKVGHFNDSKEILEFVGGADLERLAALGTSCPDHFLRTKILPLIVDADGFSDGGSDYLDELFTRYRDRYAAYYERCKRPDSPEMRDANPVVCLVPGVGMITFAADKATARIAGEFYTNAVNVMRGAEAVGRYQGLDEQEAFDIEYWALEEAKLQRQPAPKPLAGRIAFITGGAGGIGFATAERLLGDGACVALADIDETALSAAKADLVERHGADRVTALICDVTAEANVRAAFDKTCLAFGGVDILVANAGLASSAPIEETSLELWRKNFAVLSEGYFLVARSAFALMKANGGSIVFVASKNALAAAANASAYAAAKAAELHLARCLALEGAPHGIRVNSVNPDAVLSKSKIWTGPWRDERAAAYGIAPDELEDFYKNRSLLKQSVLPQDIAEAVAFFAGDRSAKSTGNILNVDAGNAQSFPR
ncbi:MAG: bifunctional rhamnulose-1-phosphate aldolase/short-chain dehydrogenase [Pseudomonadota bacterium]